MRQSIKTIWLSLTLLAVLTISSQLHAQLIVKFDNDVDRTRYYALLEELRCPKCQNQSLADSDAVIAEDLRVQVYEMIKAGRSDQEIILFMVERYGEFVLYRPQFSMTNSVLWGVPITLILLVLVVALRRMTSNSVVSGSGLDNADEHAIEQRLSALEASTQSEDK